MKIFISIVLIAAAFLYSFFLLSSMRLNNDLLLKKTALGYSTKTKQNKYRLIPAALCVLLAFVLQLPPAVEEDKPSLMLSSRNMQMSNGSIVLRDSIELGISTMNYKDQRIVGTLSLDTNESYSVFIENNRFYYLDQNGIIYENLRE